MFDALSLDAQNILDVMLGDAQAVRSPDARLLRLCLRIIGAV